MPHSPLDFCPGLSVMTCVNPYHRRWSSQYGAGSCLLVALLRQNVNLERREAAIISFKWSLT